MGAMMGIMQAIETRISCRAFTNRQIDSATFGRLQAEVEAINGESGLAFQLYGPRENGTAIDMSRKMFSGNPPAYAALVADKGALPEEMLGYYGERLVLLATQLGLGTCWVARTYDSSTTRVMLEPGQVLHDVIPIGYAPDKIPLVQRTIRSRIRARSKSNEDLYRGPTSLSESPAWLQQAIQAVQLAPSAICEQPVVFVQDEPDGPLRAEVIGVTSQLEYTDLGIAKLHFQIAASAYGVPGTWEWGDGGSYLIEA